VSQLSSNTVSQLEEEREIFERLQEIQDKISIKRAHYAELVKKFADSMPSKPNFYTTVSRFIDKAVIEDECVFYIVYGPLRYGKTAYAVKSIAPIYDTWSPQILKQFIVFKPIEFCTRLKRIIEMKQKFPCFVWDDAGVWLNALKHNDPIIKRVGEYFQTIGTHFNAVLLTSPLPSYIVKRLRGLPNCVNIRIYKLHQYANKMRLAKGYYFNLLPDMKKTTVKPIIDDRFSAIMPTVFYDWYKPYRQLYADESFQAFEQQLYADAQEQLNKEEKPPEFNKESKFYKSSVEPTEELIGTEDELNED